MQGTGLVKEHCSPRCKQQAYRERKKVEEALRAEEEDLTRRAETRIAEAREERETESLERVRRRTA